MVSEVLNLIVSVEVEVFAAVEVRVLRVGVLNAVLIEIGPRSVHNALVDLAILGPGYLKIGSITDSQNVTLTVLQIVSFSVVVEGQVGEVGPRGGHRNWIQRHSLVPIITIAVTRISQPVCMAVEYAYILRKHVI